MLDAHSRLVDYGKREHHQDLTCQLHNSRPFASILTTVATLAARPSVPSGDLLVSPYRITEPSSVFSTDLTEPRLRGSCGVRLNGGLLSADLSSYDKRNDIATDDSAVGSQFSFHANRSR